MTDTPKPPLAELGPNANKSAAADRPRHANEDQRVRDFVVEACRLISDSHCEDVIAYDVRGESDVTDYVLIASGTSDRQARSVAEDLEQLAGGHGLRRFGRDEDKTSTWIVVDFVDVVVHLFEPVTRAYYDLEMMWGDAPKVPWQR